MRERLGQWAAVLIVCIWCSVLLIALAVLSPVTMLIERDRKKQK